MYVFVPIWTNESSPTIVFCLAKPTRVKPFQKLDGRSQQSLHRSDDIKHTTEIPSGDIGEVIPRESTAESDLKQVGANVDELPGLIFGTEATVPEFFSSNGKFALCWDVDTLSALLNAPGVV